MRKITNNAMLPAPMYRALAADTYSGSSWGDSSATRIILPPRIAILRAMHEDEIEEDASDRIWSLLGSSVHRMLELSADPDKGEVAERRMGIPIRGVEVPDWINSIPIPILKKMPGFKNLEIGEQWKWTVTAQADILEPVLVNEKENGNYLYDYKVTSVWSVLSGEKPEWEKQVNINAGIHRHNDERVDRAGIVTVMRDWVVRKARYEKEYPKQAVKLISIPLWTQEEVLEYMRRRVKQHQDALLRYVRSNMDPNVLPMCSDDERWYRGHAFAVKFKTIKGDKVNKNAKRKFESRVEAQQFIKDNPTLPPKGKEWAPIEERPGENIRCLDYCDVWFKCPFGKQLREQAAAAALVNEKTEEEEEG